jgi:branched-chain amino acid transport system substrate-binding protein
VGSFALPFIFWLALADPGEEKAPPDGAPSATLGLLLGGEGPLAATNEEIRRGAELALSLPAADGGPRAEKPALPIRVVAAQAGGKWEAGAGELVRLVYKEGAAAVLGPADGRAAHLAEQVVTRGKGRFVLLTPWASDPTLTEIKIPWFFRLVPEDRKQAEALLAEIHGARKISRIAAVAVKGEYDSRAALEALDRAARSRPGLELRAIRLAEGGTDLGNLAGEVKEEGAGAVALLLAPGPAARAARLLRTADPSLVLFGPLALATGEFLDAAGEAAEGMVLAAPSEAEGPLADRFRERYREAHRARPAAAAAFGFDGARALVEALRTSGGAGGEPLRAALAALRVDGLTGRVEFDATGDRKGPSPLARVERGRLAALGPAPAR